MKEKIAILLPAMEVGGAERLVLEELSVLKMDKRFDFEVHLVFGRGPLFESLVKLNIPVRVWNARHKSIMMIWSYWRIANYLRRHRFSVLHCHLLYSLGPIVGILAGVRKIVTTVHTKKKMSRMEKFGLKRSHVVLACGAQVADHLQGLIPASSLKILNNSISNPKRNAKLRYKANEIYGLDNGQKIFLSVGRLIYDKGFDVLINAFLSVSSESPTALLLIAGDGPERMRLDQQISDLSLQNHVRLLGTIYDVAPLFERADFYVNSSRREGLPLTLLEASAYCKPIVATDAGGSKEVIADGVTGLLVKHSDPEVLTNALLHLLKNAMESNQLASRANDLFKKKYSMEQHLTELTAHYLL